MTAIMISIDTEKKKNYDQCQDLLQQNYGKGTEGLPTCCNYYACTHTVMVGAGIPAELDSLGDGSMHMPVEDYLDCIN